MFSGKRKKDKNCSNNKTNINNIHINQHTPKKKPMSQPSLLYANALWSLLYGFCRYPNRTLLKFCTKTWPHHLSQVNRATMVTIQDWRYSTKKLCKSINVFFFFFRGIIIVILLMWAVFCDNFKVTLQFMQRKETNLWITSYRNNN